MLVLPHSARGALPVAKAILRNSVDAEEVTQEAVLKGLCNIHGFRGDTKFSTWLIQITIDEAREQAYEGTGDTWTSELGLNEQQTGNADEYVLLKIRGTGSKFPPQPLEGSELQNALAASAGIFATKVPRESSR